MPDTITISDLEVFYCVGVPDEERAQPQRLVLTIQMEHDFRAAAVEDELRDTIYYFAVSQRLLKFGDRVLRKLIETLTVELALTSREALSPRSATFEATSVMLTQT